MIIEVKPMDQEIIKDKRSQGAQNGTGWYFESLKVYSGWSKGFGGCLSFLFFLYTEVKSLPKCLSKDVLEQCSSQPVVAPKKAERSERKVRNMDL